MSLVQRASYFLGSQRRSIERKNQRRLIEKKEKKSRQIERKKIYHASKIIQDNKFGEEYKETNKEKKREATRENQSRVFIGIYIENLNQDSSTVFKLT